MLMMPQSSHALRAAATVYNEKVVFHSDEGNITVLKLTMQNIAKYKKQMLAIAKTLPDRTPVPSIKDYEVIYRYLIENSGLTEDGLVHYVALSGNTVRGYVLCDVDTKNGLVLNLYTIGINKKYENRGIGNLLLREAAKKAESMQIFVITAEVKKGNERLIRFFCNRGFEIARVALDVFDLKAQVSSVLEATGKNISLAPAYASYDTLTAIQGAA